MSRLLAAAALAAIAGATILTAAGTTPAGPAYTCQAERSNTREGVEIIAYPADQIRHLGIVIACPKQVRP